jgi:hypothetical protein
MAFSPVFGITSAQISDTIAYLDSLTTAQIASVPPSALAMAGSYGNFRTLADRVIAGRTHADEYSLR